MKMTRGSLAKFAVTMACSAFFVVRPAAIYW
jgi:high-affinity K+ transport system ATPase subunit B